MLKNTDNPWLGLASYEYKDAYRFFGRQKELVELKTAICNNPFTTIYGISGAGKTSLINAGMLPLLEKENYLPVRIRLEHQSKIGYNSQIVMAIKNAVDIVGAEIEFRDELDIEDVSEEEKLWCFLFASKIWSSTNHQLIPVIFIDQFEEIFTKNETEETVSRFFDCINSLQYNTPPEHISLLLEQKNKYVDYNDVAQFRMVFIMREDFLARLEDHSFDIPALRKNRRGIKRMDGHQALEVILRPCLGIVSREVALQILGKVTGRAVRDSETALNRLSVDTSILSLFCSELYQKAVEADADVITEELVGQFGDDIIASFYEDTMKLVSNETMEYLEAHLLTYSGFRNTVALEDLTQNGIKPEELEKLAEKRLVRIETLDGTERVEFMHDVLCKVAKEHRDARKEEIRQNVRLKRLRRNNIGFLTSAIVGLITLVVFSWLRSQLFGYMPLCGTLSFELPYILFFSFLLGGVYLLLFENKISKYLIIRYLLVLIIAMLMVVGIYSIQTFLYNDDNWLRRWYIHRYADMDDISVRFVLFVLCLIVSYIMDCFSKRKAILVISKTLVMLTLVRAVIIVGFSGAWALIFYFFALFILLPYRFTIEKNAWWITLLSFIMVIWALLLLYPEDDVAVPCFIVLLLSIGLSIYYLVRYKKERTAKEAWDYCISLKSYKEHPFFVKTMAVIALLLVLVFSVQVGLRLVDRYTLLGIAFFVPVSYALINFLTFGTANLRLKFSAPSILFLLLLAGIVVSQYLYGRLLWLVLVWLAAAYYVYKYSKLYNHSAASRWTIKKDVLPCFVIWFVSFFCIPILCMGYNVFSLPQFARVYDSNAVYREYAHPSMMVKNAKGKVGVRDRNGMLVPVEYEIVLRGRNFRKKNYEPVLLFNVKKADGSEMVWDCSNHLELDNDFTKLFVAYYDQLTNTSYSFTDDGVKKYADYVRSLKSESKTERLIKNILVYNIQKCASRDNNYLSLQTLNDVRRMNERIKAKDFAYSLSQSAPYFSYLDSNHLPRLVLDTLFRNCAEYESCINYADLVKFRIYAKDYEKALTDANESKNRNEVFADSRLIEALYFTGQYDYAFSLLENKKDSIINLDEYGEVCREFMQYKYLGDAVWQDIVEYKRIGILQDTASQYYLRLEDVLKLEKTHPYYDYIRQLPNIVWPAKILVDNEDYELCICKGDGYHNYSFIMYEREVLGPIMKSFAVSEDDEMMLIVDKMDDKRKYLKVFGDSLRLLPGCYDHAWRFSEGLAVVSIDNKIGVINKEGDYVIEPIFSMPYYYCYGASKWIVDGQYVKFDDIYSRENYWYIDFVFQNGLCPMSDKNGYFGLINEQGEWVVDPVYDFIGKPDDMGNRVVIRNLVEEMPYWIKRRNIIKNPRDISDYSDLSDPDIWTIGEIDRYGNYCPVKQR